MKCYKLSFSISRRTSLTSFCLVKGILLMWILLATTSVTAHAQDAENPCNVSGFGHQTWSEATQFGHGLKSVPRAVIRPRNLLWELPILAATGVMIAKVDRPADRRIQSRSLQQTASLWSNVGLGMELGSGALGYGVGCGHHHSYLRDTGFKALAAMGAAGTVDLHNHWLKWSAYALATGVSLSRYPAKKHFPSDILMGATLGYVTGAYLGDH